jgi:hypothetical protein
MRLLGDSRSFCIDTLNGDGLKNAEMVYLLPDEIFYSFGNCLQQLISSSFHARLDKLVSTCWERQYGVITLRYWVDCPRSLSREHPETRPLTTWSESEQLKQYLSLICMEKKWTRNPLLALPRSALQKTASRSRVSEIFCLHLIAGWPHFL